MQESHQASVTGTLTVIGQSKSNPLTLKKADVLWLDVSATMCGPDWCHSLLGGWDVKVMGNTLRDAWFSIPMHIKEKICFTLPCSSLGVQQYSFMFETPMI